MAVKISRKALNRATLDRQFLLRRTDLPLQQALEQLVGLQAQTTTSWYHGMWTRVTGFDPYALSELLSNRSVVRMVVMRGTIHLVTAEDALFLRPLTQIVSTRAFQLADLDYDEVIRVGRGLVEGKPMIFSELGKHLAKQWPTHDPSKLAHVVRAHVPLVQIPPRGLWGGSGIAAHTTVESWLGRSVHAEPSVDQLVIRYLAAFGPASVKDAQTWSGLTKLGEVFTRLRPQLVTFEDENGRELFDLPDAPRPAEDTPAPVRFLYEYDNLLLSHQDRTRVATPEWLAQERPINGVLPKIFLVNGFTAGMWSVTGGTLTISPYRPLSKKDTAALVREGGKLLEFAASGQSHRVEILAPN